jgi:hypothetical protein
MRPAADAMIFPSCPPLAASLPPWSVDEQEACFILRDANGQALGLRLFRGGAGVTVGCPFAHARRSPAHCRQRRQAAGAAAWAPPIKRGVTRLQPHIHDVRAMSA